MCLLVIGPLQTYLCLLWHLRDIAKNMSRRWIEIALGKNVHSIFISYTICISFCCNEWLETAWLKRTEIYFLTVPGTPEVENQGVSRAALLPRVLGENPFCLSQLPETFGGPGPIAAFLWSLPRLHKAFSLPVFSLLSFIRHLEPVQMLYNDFIWDPELKYIYKGPFSKVPFTASGCQDVHKFWGTLFIPIPQYLHWQPGAYWPAPSECLGFLYHFCLWRCVHTLLLTMGIYSLASGTRAPAFDTRWDDLLEKDEPFLQSLCPHPKGNKCPYLASWPLLHDDSFLSIVLGPC